MLTQKMLNAPFRYRIVSEILASYDCDKYTTYGIQTVFECDERLIVYSTVSDISTDRSQVEEMVEIFNEHELSPLHLIDVIEDMLP